MLCFKCSSVDVIELSRKDVYNNLKQKMWETSVVKEKLDEYLFGRNISSSSVCQLGLYLIVSILC